MIKIMFVCHGNICRSPMAEYVFRDMVQKNGVDEKFLITSSATSSEEIINGVGNPVYPPVRRLLEEKNIDTSAKRARKLLSTDLEKYDLFIGMDNKNVKNMEIILGQEAGGKIYRLLDFAGEHRDIADPWYTEKFDVTYADVCRGCHALLEFLLKRGE